LFYLYDANGNLTFKQDARYQTSFTYDALDRLTGKTWTPVIADLPTMTEVTYCYDAACGGAAVANAKGRLVRAANGAGSTRFNEYDALGRVKSTTQVVADAGGGTHNFAYVYDLAGNLTAMTYPSGLVVQTGYDTAGRVSHVRDGATQARFGEVAEYAEHGAIKTLKLGEQFTVPNLIPGPNPATTENWTYNNRLQPFETVLRKTGSSLNSLRLQYFYCAGQAVTCTNNNGNLRSQTIGHDAVGTEPAWSVVQTYDYDALNRLTEFNEGGKTEANGYDEWGNRWATVNGLPDSPLRPTASSWFSPNNNRMSGVNYDEVGNQRQFNPFTLTYDAEGHVVSAASSGNGSATYAYDADGRKHPMNTGPGGLGAGGGPVVRE
jgi:YD repeat-containing protein